MTVLNHGQPLLGWRNNLQGAQIQAGSQVQAAPGRNVATDIGAEPWQTAGVRTAQNGAWLEIDAGQVVDWRGFWIGRTNLTAGAQIRWLLGLPERYLNLPGASGDYASTPDSAALDITGDIVVEADLEPTAWAGTNLGIIAKTAGSNRSFRFRLDRTGRLRFAWSSDGSHGSEISVVSTVTIPATPLRRKVKATLLVDNGAGGYEVRFYTALVGSDWEQLGAAIVGGAITSINAGSNAVEIGSYGFSGRNMPFLGRVFAARVYDGLGMDGLGGTLVAEFNPTRDSQVGAATVTSDTTGEVWTVQGNAAIERTFSPTVYDSGLLDGLEPGYGQIVHCASDPLQSRYARLEIDDPANPDGFIRVGLAFAGPLWAPERGISYGARFGWGGQRSDQTTRGGQVYAVPLYQERSWDVSFRALFEHEVYGEGLEVQRLAEQGGNVLFVPRPGNERENVEAVFGQITSGGLFGFPYPLTREWAFTITERL